MKKLPILALLATLLLCALPARVQAFDSPLSKAAARVSILPSKVVMDDGTTRQLTAKITPAQTASRFVWTVEDGARAVSVSQSGLVTALEPGSAFVRATDEATGKYARRKITVKSVRVTAVKLNRVSLTLQAGETSTELTAAISPQNASIKQVRWTSGTPSVATVDAATGAVTAVSSGTATITASAGSKTASCRVKVSSSYATFTISAVGDVVLGGDPQVKSALNRITEQVFAQLLAQYGEDYPFKNVASILRADDLTIANLEGTLTTHAEYRASKPHVFKGQPAYARILKNAGIEVCNLANNHSKDFGTVGFRETQASLTAQGISYCDFTDDCYVSLTKNGVTIRVGFAGFQTPVPLETMRARVKLLNKRCDVAVVSFHWCDTKEWVAKNFASDKRMARAAVAAGADLVLGHHRHVPAGIERFQGKYIVYDLSNFVVGIKHKANAQGRPLTDSMIFQWSFTVDDSGCVADAGIRVVPCATTQSTQTYPATDEFGDLGAPINDWQPVVLTGEAGRAVIARIQAMSGVVVPMAQ